MSTDLNFDFSELPRIPEGLEAAVFILQAKKRLRLHRDARPSNRVDRAARAAPPKALTIRAAASRFNCSKSSVGKQLRSLTTTGKPYLRLGNVGRPRSLTNAEEDAVVAYAVGLCWGGFDAGQEMVIEAANTLRRRRSPPAGPVSEKGIYSSNVTLRRKGFSRPMLRYEERGFTRPMLRLRRKGFEERDLLVQCYVAKKGI